MSKKYDSAKDTTRHIRKVGERLEEVSVTLLGRAMKHDASKLCDPEKSVFDEMTPKLKSSSYGSDEYKGFLKDMKVALDHHYKVNRHHPEHFDGGIHDMNMIDLLEMLCDWKAATERHDDGDLSRSIDLNTERFGMTEAQANLLRSTAVELGWMPNNQTSANESE
jgi:hypothetical protein